MSEFTKIPWCHHTFNPWEGCTKVSPACDLCYAWKRNLRFSGGVNWGKGAPRRRTEKANWRGPVKWNREAGLTTEGAENTEKREGKRPRVFCASLADWLDDEVPIEWLADLLALIYATQNLDWLLLTKRPENWRERLIDAMNWMDENGPKEPGGVPDVYSGPFAPVALMIERWCCDETPPANVWMGTTVEDQTRANERIPVLLKIPARVRFLSCEPLLGAVDLGAAYPCGYADREAPQIHWVITGTESGHGARRTDLALMRSLKAQCAEAGVAFFNKQITDSHGRQIPMEMWPEDLRVREFPRVV